MCSTYSEIYSSVYLNLGSPTDDLLDKLELSNIVTQWLSLRMESVRQSEQGISISKSATFTLAANEDEIDLTAVIPDFVMPMWVEMQLWSYLSNPVWQFVPTVNISLLQQKRGLGQPAVAFHGENARQVKATFSYFGQDLMVYPTRNFRVWYLPTIPFPTSEDGEIALPENLVNMITADATVGAIPLMIANASSQLKDRPELKDQMEAWKGLYAHYTMFQKRFEEWFEKYRRESRGSHRPRRRGDVLNGGGALINRTTALGGPIN